MMHYRVFANPAAELTLRWHLPEGVIGGLCNRLTCNNRGLNTGTQIAPAGSRREICKAARAVGKRA